MTMPDRAEPAAAAAAPPVKPLKLRESCDSCLTAKVKCSKARPLCGRCLANGAPCAYSPSSRAGKRNRNSTGGITKSINTSTSHNHTVPPSPRSPLPANTSFLTRLMYPLLDEDDRSLLSPTNGVFEAPTSPLLQETSGLRPVAEKGSDPAQNGDTFGASDFLPTPPFASGDFMESFMPNSGASSFPDFITAPPSPGLSADNGTLSPVWTTKENTYLRLPTFQSPLDLMPIQSSSTQITPRPPTTPQNQPGRSINSTNPERLQTCDCFAACLQVLQSLHNHSWLLSSTQQGGPPFDIVLTINREAIECCSTLLDCSKCVSKSGRSISTMMLATIFGKVMSLYRAACFLRFGPSTNSMQGTAQLAFGAYTVTGENRQLLEIEILLLELRKVESILQVYSDKFRNLQAEKDDETNVYNALTSYLHKNLHYIVDFLQMRKSGALK